MTPAMACNTEKNDDRKRKTKTDQSQHEPTPWEDAVLSDDVDAIRELCIRRDNCQCRRMEKAVNRHGETALFCAVRSDAEDATAESASTDARDVVDLLLKNGADPNALNVHGQPPLFFANTRHSIRQLMEAGARLDISDEGGSDLLSHWLKTSPSSIPILLECIHEKLKLWTQRGGDAEDMSVHPLLLACMGARSFHVKDFVARLLKACSTLLDTFIQKRVWEAVDWLCRLMPRILPMYGYDSPSPTKWDHVLLDALQRRCVAHAFAGQKDRRLFRAFLQVLSFQERQLLTDDWLQRCISKCLDALPSDPLSIPDAKSDLVRSASHSSASTSVLLPPPLEETDEGYQRQLARFFRVLCFLVDDTRLRSQLVDRCLDMMTKQKPGFEKAARYLLETKADLCSDLHQPFVLATNTTTSLSSGKPAPTSLSVSGRALPATTAAERKESAPLPQSPTTEWTRLLHRLQLHQYRHALQSIWELPLEQLHAKVGALQQTILHLVVMYCPHRSLIGAVLKRRKGLGADVTNRLHETPFYKAFQYGLSRSILEPLHLAGASVNVLLDQRLSVPYPVVYDPVIRERFFSCLLLSSVNREVFLEALGSRVEWNLMAYLDYSSGVIHESIWDDEEAMEYYQAALAAFHPVTTTTKGDATCVGTSCRSLDQGGGNSRRQAVQTLPNDGPTQGTSDRKASLVPRDLVHLYRRLARLHDRAGKQTEAARYQQLASEHRLRS